MWLSKTWYYIVIMTVFWKLCAQPEVLLQPRSLGIRTVSFSMWLKTMFLRLRLSDSQGSLAIISISWWTMCLITSLGHIASVLEIIFRQPIAHYLRPWEVRVSSQNMKHEKSNCIIWNRISSRIYIIALHDFLTNSS